MEGTARLETEVPDKWREILEEIGKERGNTSKRQLIREAIYNTHIKPHLDSKSE